jgi:hypothetical protein
VIEDVLFLREERLILKPVIVRSEEKVEEEVVEDVEVSRPYDDVKNTYGVNEDDDVLARLADMGIKPDEGGVR